jgi:hypothetical protein
MAGDRDRARTVVCWTQDREILRSSRNQASTRRKRIKHRCHDQFSWRQRKSAAEPGARRSKEPSGAEKRVANESPWRTDRNAAPARLRSCRKIKSEREKSPGYRSIELEPKPKLKIRSGRPRKNTNRKTSDSAN